MSHAYKPQSMRSLRLRLRDALERIWDCTEPGLAEQERTGIRPGNDPRNIFDFQNGIRMIISREQVDQGIWIHISCSVQPGTELGAKLAMMVGQHSLDVINREFERSCRKYYKRLTGDGSGMQKVHTSEKSVPHWVIWQKREKPIDQPIATG